MTDKPDDAPDVETEKAPTYSDVLGEKTAIAIWKAAQKEGREAFNKARDKAKDGEERMPYTKRQHHAIVTVLRELRTRQALSEAALCTIIDRQAKEIDELKARPMVWEPDKTYQAGNVVTFGGARWKANAISTGARPNLSKDHWTKQA